MLQRVVMVSVEAIMIASSCRAENIPNIQIGQNAAPFSPLFDLLFVNPPGVDVVHGTFSRQDVGTRCSLFGHSRPLISTDKPDHDIDSTQHRR